jgi:hypothetical protein
MLGTNAIFSRRQSESNIFPHVANNVEESLYGNVKAKFKSFWCSVCLLGNKEDANHAVYISDIVCI